MCGATWPNAPSSSQYSELLEPEAVELACRVIRECARAEPIQVEGQEAPAVVAIAAQIAELEDLIASRDALAVTP